MDNKGKFDRYFKIVFWGFILAILYHYFMGSVGGWGWPYNTFLFRPEDRFMDFNNSIIFSKYLLNGDFVYGHRMWNTYMPLVNWIGVPFLPVGKAGAVIIYSGMVVLLFSGIWWAVLRRSLEYSPKKSVWLLLFTCVTSYSLLFLLDRGNYEGFIFIFLGFFLYFYQKRRYIPALICLALGSSLKPFLGVFILLFLGDRRYKESIGFVILTSFLYILELALLPGGFMRNLHGWLLDMKRYEAIYVIGLNGAFFGHTAYNVLNVINSSMHFIPNPVYLRKGYLLFASLSFIFIGGYLVKFEKVFWRKVFLITLIMVGLPLASNDYSLIHLYYPFILFLGSETSDYKMDSKLVTLFGLLMIPKQYFIFIDHPKATEILKYGISIFLNPLLIYGLFTLLLSYGWKENDRLGSGTQSLSGEQS